MTLQEIKFNIFYLVRSNFFWSQSVETFMSNKHIFLNNKRPHDMMENKEEAGILYSKLKVWFNGNNQFEVEK